MFVNPIDSSAHGLESTLISKAGIPLGSACMMTDGVEGFFTDIMLNFASILSRSFLINAEMDEKFCEQLMSLINSSGNVQTGISQ